MSSKLPPLLRRFSCICRRRPNNLESNSSAFAFFRLLSPSDPWRNLGFPLQIDPSPRSFSTGQANVQGPTSIDYHSLLQEDEFHRLADSTIHGLQESLEEYGDLTLIMGGPSRFDWDQESKGWVYRRTGANLLGLLESEMLNLCRQPIQLS